MNTVFFKYALEVERTRSITQAAENLFMAQPNLSKAMKELEDTLGITIFQRTSKGVIPTEKGHEFLSYARNIIMEIEKMEGIATPNDLNTQRFTVSIPRGSYISHSFTKFVEGLDMNKGINLNIQETNSMQTIQNVAEGAFNLGIIRYQISYERYFLDFLEDKKLLCEPVWEFEYLALMSKKHLLAKVQQVHYEELKKCTEIVHGDITIPYLSTKENLKRKQSNELVRKIFLYERGNQFELLGSIPSTYMWVSPIPSEQLERYELIQRKCIDHSPRFKDLLVYKRGYSLTEWDRSFIVQLHKTRDELSNKEYY